MREADIQREILQFLSLSGVPALRVNTGRAWVGHGRFLKFGDEGFPDLLAWPGRGITLAIEVKRPDEGLTPAQIHWAKRLMAKGIHHVVARSVEDVVWKIRVLREAA